MAKARKSGDDEVNLDSLMDALTNVVGILMIVFVLVQLNAAEAVKKILEDLPDITEEELEELEEEAEQAEGKLQEAEDDWKEKQDQSKAIYKELKAAKEQKRRLEETTKKNKIEVYDLASLEKKKLELEKKIELKKKEEEEMLARIEQLERAIDDTPVYVPKKSQVVRMPNPRPIPDGGVEFKFLVSGNKISYINEAAYNEQLLEEMKRVKEQALWERPPSQPYADLLAKGLGGNKDLARKLWPAFESLASNFQMHDLISGFSKLHTLGFDLTSSKITQNLAIIAGSNRRNLSDLASAFEAFIKDPSAKIPDREQSVLALFGINVTPPDGGKMNLVFGEHRTVVTTANPKAGLMEFVKDADDARDRKKNYLERKIYDGKKVVTYLNDQSKKGRLGDRQCMTVIKEPSATSSRLQYEIGPREGAGEGPEDIKDPASTFQRAMRKIASEPNSYAWFYVNGDSFSMYLDARNIADEMKTLAGWEPYPQPNFVKTVSDLEIVQLQALAPRKPPPPGAKKAAIKDVGKSLD